jgi:hypothetical protein
MVVFFAIACPLKTDWKGKSLLRQQATSQIFPIGERNGVFAYLFLAFEGQRLRDNEFAVYA